MNEVRSGLRQSCAIALALLFPTCWPGRAEVSTVDRAAAAAIAETTTSANPDPAYGALLAREQRDIAATTRAAENTPPKPNIEKTRRTASSLRTALTASTGYAFAPFQDQAADIQILLPFKALQPAALARNDAIVTAINHDASLAQQRHALFDADGVTRMFPLAEALGPKLGNAFLAALEANEIGKAATLIGASIVGTGPAKLFFAYPRPFRVAGNTIRLVKDEDVTGDGKPYIASGFAFPSGHTTVGYTAALLLAAMLPERFLPLVSRAAGYGYSRLVLGVHYPLDVIGGRMIAERNVSRLLADGGFQVLLGPARDELRRALERECGEPVPACGKAGSSTADPWAAPDQRRFYHYTMTYDLPRIGSADMPMTVPAGAESLLAALRPGLSAAQRRTLLARTASPSGYPLDPGGAQDAAWERLDLFEAGMAE